MRRKKLNRKASKRNFRSGTKINKKNIRAAPMRGGIRL